MRRGGLMSMLYAQVASRRLDRCDTLRDSAQVSAVVFREFHTRCQGDGPHAGPPKIQHAAFPARDSDRRKTAGKSTTAKATPMQIHKFRAREIWVMADLAKVRAVMVANAGSTHLGRGHLPSFRAAAIAV
jgi:hypothetical protein